MRRRGFSLIEVLLVLALLAAVAALAWPSVKRQFDTYRLRTAADMIRTEWCLARIEAMRSGCVYTFRRSSDGNHFCTRRGGDGVTAPMAQPRSQALSQPASQPDRQAPSAGYPPGGGTPSQTTVAAAAPPQQPAEKVLPEGVEFMGLEAAPDAAGADTEAMAAPQDPAGPDWSDPIFFYPDGTTSDAQLTLKNGQHRAIELNLRGLTGTVDVGDILSVEE